MSELVTPVTDEDVERALVEAADPVSDEDRPVETDAEEEAPQES